MAFIDDPVVQATVRTTIERVEKLEEKEATRLLRTFKQIRQDLRDRLDILSGDTFTAQNQRGVLIQVDAAIGAINQSLKSEMVESGERLAILGSEDTIREINRFNKEFTGAIIPLNINAALNATESRNFLVNRYQASIDAYSMDLRGSITANLSSLSLQQVPFDTVIRKLGKFFIGEEWKLRRIARTELHNTYNLSKINAFDDAKETIPNLKKTLFHPIDARTGEDSKQLKASDQVVDIDKPFRFVFVRTLSDGTTKREVREFMAPPDRPNDRAVLIPFREEWNK